MVILLGSLIRLPYFSLGPGPSVDMFQQIEVRGTDTFPSQGQLLLTTVSISSSTLTTWQGLVVWLRGDESAIKAELLRPTGESDEESDASNFADMELSKVSAEVAAFRALGLSVSPLPGAVVLSIVEGAPADGRLRTGDRIVAVDGRGANSVELVQRAIGDRKPGQRVKLTVIRRGERVTTTIRTRPAKDEPKHPVVGISLGKTYKLPHEVEIDSQNIGGPSGGLVFALALFDQLNEEDLTKGRIIAVTGQIAESGRVLPIGGVEEKARAARKSGATVFVVPKSEVAAARGSAPESLTILGVDSLYEAIVKLRALPAP